MAKRLWLLAILLTAGLLFSSCSCGKDKVTGPVDNPGKLEVTVKEDRSERLLDGAQVVVEKAGSAQTKAGVALIDKVPPGNYKVTVTKQGYLTETKTVSVQLNSKTSLTVHLYPAGMGDLVVWVSLELPGALVDAQVKIGAETAQALATLPAEFRLKVGKYAVMASRVSCDAKTVEATVAERTSTTINITLSATKYQGEIYGNVKDKKTGKALAQANVSLSGAKEIKRVCDNSGLFTFGALPPGDYTLCASATNYSEVTIPIKLAKDQKLRQDFALEPLPPGKVTGIVLSTAGKQLANATVRLLVNGSTIKEAQTDNFGRFELLEIIPGSYVLSGRADYYAEVQKKVEVLSGKETVANLELEPNAGDISGLVLRDSYSGTVPVDMGLAELVQPDRVLRQAPIQNNGTFLLQNVIAGSHSVSIFVDNNVALRATANVVATVSPLQTTSVSATIGFAADNITGNDSFETAVPLELGVAQNSFIWDAGDVDYWSYPVSAQTGWTVYINCNFSRDLQCYADFYDSAKTKIGSLYFGSGQSASIFFPNPLPAGETLYIKIRSAFGKWSRFDCYTIHVY